MCPRCLSEGEYRAVAVRFLRPQVVDVRRGWQHHTLEYDVHLASFAQPSMFLQLHMHGVAIAYAFRELSESISPGLYFCCHLLSVYTAGLRVRDDVAGRFAAGTKS